MSLFWSRKRPVRRSSRPSSNSASPAFVELLENRQLLSAFVVTNAQDNGNNANLIGGGENIANVIADNGMDGILIGSDPSIGYNTPAGSGNEIQVNSIYGNSHSGIDLGPNDGPNSQYFGLPADPNDTINRPVITSAGLKNTTLTVKGQFYSPVDTDIAVLVYANPAGTSQGKLVVGGFTFHATASAITSFSKDLLNVSFAPGMVITTTARNDQKSTSEFSLGVKVELVPNLK